MPCFLGPGISKVKSPDGAVELQHHLGCQLAEECGNSVYTFSPAGLRQKSRVVPTLRTPDFRIVDQFLSGSIAVGTEKMVRRWDDGSTVADGPACHVILRPSFQVLPSPLILTSDSGEIPSHVK